jgi:methionyl-tRNA formyltransferase
MKGKDLRIVFMGTPDFAVASLKTLVDNGYNVVGVVTAPDKPAGRGQKIQQSAVKQFAVEHKIPVLQPEKLKDEQFIAGLRLLNADLQVIVAFRMLPEIVWNMPRLGTFNLHGSILPHYRGAAPLNWAVINGDKESGVSTFLLKHEIDTGNIIFQEKVEIGPDETVGELHDKLMIIGSELVVRTVDALAEGAVKPIPQDNFRADPARIHAPKIFKEDCRINWNNPGIKIHNQIRGLSPYPTAWTELEGEETISLKIFRSSFETDGNPPAPGTIFSDQKHFLKVACTDGFISISDLQMAGKKRMGVEEFLRGFAKISSYKAR